MRAAITATGHYVPSDVYPNEYFERRLDTTDAWIQSRTGIAERRFASTGGTSDLIVPAARRCLDARPRLDVAFNGSTSVRRVGTKRQASALFVQSRRLLPTSAAAILVFSYEE